MKISTVILIITAGISSSAALNPIVIKGSKFFDSVTKNQFFIKGVAYQPRSHATSEIPDPLADPAACARDASLMAELGTNVLRVYEVDPKKNHDECMKIYEDAGIYLLLDIATSEFSINRERPEYTVDVFNAYKSTVDTFIQYSNLFGFIAGNEVTNNNTNTEASAYVKAALRDIKAYLKNTSTRIIPVGYASNDDEFVRDPIKDYFNCGDEETQADFYGLNLYEWCGNSTFETSGFKDRTKELENYNKPVFLSEYGCNLVTPREFTEVAAIYGPSMTPVWSGGIVYEWTQENNNYGLVKIDSTGQLEPLDDFHHLKRQLSRVKPKGVQMETYQNPHPASTCPTLGQHWQASATLPPTPSQDACDCMVKSLHCLSNTTERVAVQFETICQTVSCEAIDSNPSQGAYGAFSFCSPRDKLSWLYDVRFRALATEDASPYEVCDQGGLGVQATPERSDVETCAALGPDLGAGVTTPMTDSSSDQPVVSAGSRWVSGSVQSLVWSIGLFLVL